MACPTTEGEFSQFSTGWGGRGLHHEVGKDGSSAGESRWGLHRREAGAGAGPLSWPESQPRNPSRDCCGAPRWASDQGCRLSTCGAPGCMMPGSATSLPGWAGEGVGAGHWAQLASG